MKNKYIIKIKGLDQNEQTKFIKRNLKDNVVRLKIFLLVLLFVEAILLTIILTTNIMFDTMEGRLFCFRIYIVALPIILLFLIVLRIIGKQLKNKNITTFRIIILFGLMLLLAWSTSMRLLLHDSGFQPNIYLILLVAVAVIPILNYWETILIVLPAQVFVTVNTLLSSHSMEPDLVNYLITSQ